MRPFALFALLATLLGAPALGEPKPLVVVELFTSQGCSSCPPADAMIDELAELDDVLPLALHVDYWDYIGWADNFARPQNTDRQKAYARMAHSRSLYTPQIVIGGVTHVVGFKPMQVASVVQKQLEAPVAVTIKVESEANGALRISCLPRPGAALPKQINVDLVAYLAKASIEIMHGENAGKTIDYANIVRSWERLGTWDGQGVFEAELRERPDGPVAIIVQAAGPGAVLAALKLP